MITNRRVLITGLGAVSGLGLNAATFWGALKEGRTAIRPLNPPVDGIKIAVAATVPDFDPDKYFSADELSILDRFSQFAVIAAQEQLMMLDWSMGRIFLPMRQQSSAVVVAVNILMKPLMINFINSSVNEHTL